MKKAQAAVAAWAVVAITVLSIGGCGPDKSREDARDTKDVDKTAPHVVAFNNHYANVETKCDHGNRLYVVTKGQQRLVVVPNGCLKGGQ